MLFRHNTFIDMIHHIVFVDESRYQVKLKNGQTYYFGGPYGGLYREMTGLHCVCPD